MTQPSFTAFPPAESPGAVILVAASPWICSFPMAPVASLPPVQAEAGLVASP